MSFSFLVCGWNWWGLVWVSCCNWVFLHHCSFYFNILCSLIVIKRKSFDLVWLLSFDTFYTNIFSSTFIMCPHYGHCFLLAVWESAPCTGSSAAVFHHLAFVLLLHLHHQSLPPLQNWSLASPALPLQEVRLNTVSFYLSFIALYSLRINHLLTWAFLLSSSSSSILLCLRTLALCLTRFSCSRGRSCSSWTLLLSSWNSGQNFSSSLNTDIYVQRQRTYMQPTYWKKYNINLLDTHKDRQHLCLSEDVRPQLTALV